MEGKAATRGVLGIYAAQHRLYHISTSHGFSLGRHEQAEPPKLRSLFGGSVELSDFHSSAALDLRTAHHSTSFIAPASVGRQ